MKAVKTINNKEGLQNLFFFEASGFSMWPFLKTGQKLIIKKTPIDDLRRGDIILYRANNQLICHRLIKKIKDKEGCILYARGDNSVSSPKSVTGEMLLGKAIFTIKRCKTYKLTGRKQQFIVLVAPLISMGIRIIKPWWNKLRSFIYGKKIL